METVGRILKGVGGLYNILLEDGKIIQCRARGALRHTGEKPLVGDFVSLTNENGYCIYSIVNRRNFLIRPPIANIDYLFCVIASKKPMPIIETLDKLISISEYNNIEPVIVITKSDLDAENARKLKIPYEKCGFHAFVTEPDCDYSEIFGFIKTECRGRVCAFAGNSGVGKSTLINALFPSLSLNTGVLSQKIERGRHTTRAVELFKIDNTFIADTPGFSMLDFTKFDFFTKDELKFTFREFRPYLNKCRYADCTHTREIECAVNEAIRQGIIPKSRHDSFLAMWEDLKNKPDWQK